LNGEDDVGTRVFASTFVRDALFFFAFRRDANVSGSDALGCISVKVRLEGDVDVEIKIVEQE
jgi:hypothetical protein